MEISCCSPRPAKCGSSTNAASRPASRTSAHLSGIRHGNEGRRLSIGRPRPGLFHGPGMRRCSDRTNGGETPDHATAGLCLPRRSRRRSRNTDLFRVSPRRRGGFSPVVYGNQGATIRLYNNPVVITQPSPTTRRFEADVGVRNLLEHVVGDEQAGASPPDTIGIFVFFISGPVVTAPGPCSGCTVDPRVAPRSGHLHRPEPEVLPLAGAARARRLSRRYHAISYHVALRVLTLRSRASASTCSSARRGPRLKRHNGRSSIRRTPFQRVAPSRGGGSGRAVRPARTPRAADA